ncbi:helix-turn-helix domain containing protein [Arthrobacter sp. EH-1B-1]|uniref:Helix-turn-helix domain containing protein n=1 Tax=Arthrobacter vasquezii TaxID=2977629 RepID=A0ABT6CWI6_9MICC|nr:TetR/AcrR family transcriptional regulator [Arthrobacter vasquezii]MDF9277935.1 helix-turn-helix domain containing protein [Arthrobacter vasquezii]
MGIREEHRARMLHEIQDATLDLVEEQGLDATTIGDIATRLGISERTIFRYYPSKEHALMPGQEGLIDALVACESTHTGVSGILDDLLAVCRKLFAQEVEQRDFRRISRLLIQEPELLRAVARRERDLVEALSAVLVQRGTLGFLQALLVAEVVTAAWRVTWQTFARDEFDGVDSDPVYLFDQTVSELGKLF